MHFLSAVKKTFFFTMALPALLAVLCSSCGTTRPYVYMQGSFDTAALSKIKIPENVIQKGDLISIVVFSDNPEATKIFNQYVITSTGNAGGVGGEGITQTVAGSAPNSPGYLVDENGNIQFQGLGLLHIAGLTRGELKQLLDSKLKDSLLKNPYYNIRFLNFRFTMLGEIGKPGIYTIPNEHINLLEAMALAGDMTFYARRDNLLVMREENGVRTWARLNMTKPEILSSPYFYLKQNDFVYIEQNKNKAVASDQITIRNVTIASTVVATLAIIYSIFKK